ncbi:hypothetical protein Mp_1g00610 [Marchantia polymorpha subsp. ruderalis]|uniref:Uncharacterized protein n=2 Tax=Marchantia polymorpha TaxID=3197 RepID=A0AAF6AK03_MARPO|nr:hypothetical protein MARPO_0103s0026 [Marchantia polymorpha]BBM96773.1 hypothetical protein Mp_1g00610 [Marchantia polymorpha subsp. ruderalis]|eukprot:PTQ32055.1 hypothetical protein MARPO_0103s0026 [Marchantia polymorpha]
MLMRMIRCFSMAQIGALVRSKRVEGTRGKSGAGAIVTAVNPSTVSLSLCLAVPLSLIDKAKQRKGPGALDCPLCTRQSALCSASLVHMILTLGKA